jgi:hypothetical protein
MLRLLRMPVSRSLHAVTHAHISLHVIFTALFSSSCAAQARRRESQKLQLCHNTILTRSGMVSTRHTHARPVQPCWPAPPGIDAGGSCVLLCSPTTSSLRPGYLGRCSRRSDALSGRRCSCTPTAAAPATAASLETSSPQLLPVCKLPQQTQKLQLEPHFSCPTGMDSQQQQQQQ